MGFLDKIFKKKEKSNNEGALFDTMMPKEDYVIPPKKGAAKKSGKKEKKEEQSSDAVKEETARAERLRNDAAEQKASAEELKIKAEKLRKEQTESAKKPSPKKEEKPTEEVKPVKKVPQKKEEKPAEEEKPAKKASPKKEEKLTEEAKPAKKASPKKEEKPVEEVKPEEGDKTGSRGPFFEIKKSKDDRYVFNLYAANHVIVATSQVYSSSSAAMNGIKSVIANADAPVEDQTIKNGESVTYPKWEIYRDKGEAFRFRLNASNGSTVCHSQGYTSKVSCKNGIESIRKNAAAARVEKAYLQKDEKK